MILLKRGQTTQLNIDTVVREIEAAGLKGIVSKGEVDVVIHVIGDESTKGGLFEMLGGYDFVERAKPVQSNIGYRIVAREHLPEFVGNLNTLKFNISGVEIGNGKPIIIAGPCAVHTREQLLEVAQGVKAAGANMLRGGAYKPRTSPYGFQGLGEPGLKILAEAKEITGLPIVTEVTDPRLVSLVGQYADVLQIGARNMQNYALLQEVGKYAAKNDKGILMKTSHGVPTLAEVLGAAEYLAKEGAQKIIICERGIALPTGETRNTPNPAFLRSLRKHTYLPIFGDPSHSSGESDLVTSTADQYFSAGANGLIIEVIRDTEKPSIDGTPVCDYKQGLRVSAFKQYMDNLRQRGLI
jgi:3-deoxy-7-phosphoheptulonate synthase